ncbi:MAG: flagellar basal body-associated FliL family protein [Proteobacteria bacterium]|jgi:flagellar FliL protein|nr:flagellar basal body-associated FliL family protein [Pseudomonadota bacterium]
MAAETPVSAPTPAKRSSKLLLIILLVAVLILILTVIGVGALLMMKKGAGGNAAASHEAPAVSPPSAAPAPTFTSAVDLSKPPIFVQLDPFTVNLRARENEDNHYLQTDISLRVSDQKTAEALKGWMPEIRNRINLILTSKTLQDVQDDMSHETVQNEILRGLNTMFGVPHPPPGTPETQAPLGPVQGVLFISFIVQ